MSNIVPMARPVALRTALVWRDEVMSDVVADVPQRVTVGHKGTPTFIVPDVGLPAEFAIISPGARGYLLTLGQKMRGKVCIDGREQDVSDFVARGDGAAGPGGFRATPISGRDWGVIELDDSGDYKLFFQFVPVEVPIHSNAELFSTLAVTIGLALVGMLALVVGWNFLQDYEVPVIAEWSFRSIGLIIGGLVVFAGAWSLATSDPESQASTGFSIALHGSLLVGTYFVYAHIDRQDVWPGPRSVTGNYMVSRLEDKKEEEKKKPEIVIGAKKAEDAAPKQKAKPQPKQAAMKGDEGAAGGKGEMERAVDPKARDNEKLAALDNTVFHGKSAKILNNIIDQNLTQNLGKFTGIKGDRLRAGAIGFGPGSGTGVGEGNGTGGTRGSKKGGPGSGGKAEGEFTTAGPVDTGKERAGGKCEGPNCKGVGPKAVAVIGGSIGGDTGGYTAEEINRVVKARTGIFRACYQRELNKVGGIGGKITIKFRIGADGRVISATAAGSTLANEAVQSCVAGNVARLSFPPKGAIANVTYPFLFSPGG